MFVRSVGFSAVIFQKTEVSITTAVRNLHPAWNLFFVEVELLLFLTAKQTTVYTKTRNFAPLVSKRSSYRIPKHIISQYATGRRQLGRLLHKISWEHDTLHPDKYSRAWTTGTGKARPWDLPPLHLITPTTALGATRLPMQWIPGDSAAGSDVDISSSSSPVYWLCGALLKRHVRLNDWVLTHMARW
jgi:hypothetical protein